MIVYIVIILEFICLCAVISAGGLWAGSKLGTRPKYRDEQTLIGGTIWSQIVIPIGLLISVIVEEPLDVFVLQYFVITGVIITSITGTLLISREWRMMKIRPGDSPPVPPLPKRYDSTYLGIGLLLTVAAVLKFTEFILICEF
ncbi:unnamed protein product [Arctia plantaginis]|uniref:Uncharacterized protein n=1 Tax=Arctia plantaginis TaxID=874455 RepID=A0A8S0YUP0_ARCPL|nr:unnamed protein product [Arctia plantaginis]CAB3247963.1 unnamed protein product [Arctia plantaginis]